LTSGTGPNLIVDETVFDDGVKDTLKGEKGVDWFFASEQDKVKDEKSYEELETL